MRLQVFAFDYSAYSVGGTLVVDTCAGVMADTAMFVSTGCPSTLANAGNCVVSGLIGLVS